MCPITFMQKEKAVEKNLTRPAIILQMLKLQTFFLFLTFSVLMKWKTVMSMPVFVCSFVVDAQIL